MINIVKNLRFWSLEQLQFQEVWSRKALETHNEEQGIAKVSRIRSFVLRMSNTREVGQGRFVSRVIIGVFFERGTTEPVGVRQKLVDPIKRRKAFKGKSRRAGRTGLDAAIN